MQRFSLVSSNIIPIFEHCYYLICFCYSLYSSQKVRRRFRGWKTIPWQSCSSSSSSTVTSHSVSQCAWVASFYVLSQPHSSLTALPWPRNQNWLLLLMNLRWLPVWYFFKIYCPEYPNLRYLQHIPSSSRYQCQVSISNSTFFKI